MPDGSIEIWDHDSNANAINYGITSPSNLLSPNIAGLRFRGYQANGTTETAIAELPPDKNDMVTPQVGMGL